MMTSPAQVQASGCCIPNCQNILYCIVLYIQILYLKRNRNCVSSCREFDVIGVKSKGRGSKTCERFVTHNSQLVNDLEYGDDMHANYFSRHSTSPNHRACIPLLDSRRLRSRECRGVTVRSIQLRWYPFLTLARNSYTYSKFFNTGSIRVKS